MSETLDATEDECYVRLHLLYITFLKLCAVNITQYLVDENINLLLLMFNIRAVNKIFRFFFSLTNLNRRGTYFMFVIEKKTTFYQSVNLIIHLWIVLNV